MDKNKTKRLLSIMPILLFLCCCQRNVGSLYSNQNGNFNHGWQFARDVDTTITPGFFTKKSQDSTEWKEVSLPHTAHIEPLVISGQQWQGICFYRKFFNVNKKCSDKAITLTFGAAMQKADVWLNGKHIFTNKGGYLPFTVDLTGRVKFNHPNVLLVKLNNEDDPSIPPGKPMKALDFNYFGGLYRNVTLNIKNKLHISDAVKAHRVAQGGLLVRYDHVSDSAATVQVQTDVQNENGDERQARVRVTLKDSTGTEVASKTSKMQVVAASSFAIYHTSLKVHTPHLWSPDHPYLYTLSVEINDGNEAVDGEKVAIGIRTFSISSQRGFVLNGHKMKLRGTNRHQSYPYIGYALSDNAQYRDAYKIKQAGFNFVRTSHYPPSSAFLAACDRLGIVVMDAIPGWQFFGGEAFQKLSYQNIRDMIHRDRNHPSVMIWEASLNESGMSKPFMKKANEIVHQELPFSTTYSAGWINDAYDVFIPARQHAKPPGYWNDYAKDKPLIIAEYGDWEYYAQNAGFNQKAFAGLKQEQRSSRQLRSAGQERLAQQALNFQEAHNSNLQGPAIGDANWLMYDYNRGYAADLESSGIMDIFRLPKFAYYFYQSQVGPATQGAFGKPLLYIANFWSDSTFKKVKIYSNCDEVALYVNGREIGRKKPDQDRVSTHLKHPPFTFEPDHFKSGTLRAVGYIGEKKVAETTRTTPGKATRIKLKVDYSGKKLQAGVKDIVFVHASIMDTNATVIHKASVPLTFSVDEDATLIGKNPVAAQAGIATILLRAGNHPGSITVHAKAKGLKSASLKIKSYKNADK